MRGLAFLPAPGHTHCRLPGVPLGHRSPGAAACPGCYAPSCRHRAWRTGQLRAQLYGLQRLRSGCRVSSGQASPWDACSARSRASSGRLVLPALSRVPGRVCVEFDQVGKCLIDGEPAPVALAQI